MQERNSYIAAIDEIAPPPPPYVDAQHNRPATVETNLGFVLTVANLMITAIIVIAMMLDGTQAMNAIIAGSIYFAVTMVAFTLLVTGSLTAIIADLARERTERHRIYAYKALGELAIEWRLAVEETRQIELLGRRPPAHPLPPTTQVQNYVPPFADGERAQVEGVRFAMGLFDTQGRPDPSRVHSDGRLRGRMIGSKRGSGSPEAGKWLLRAGIIQRVRGGYAIDLERFPTRDSLRHLL
jgi:hypothetical protein